MPQYRLYFTFKWKAKALGQGHRIREFTAENDAGAIKIMRTFLRSNNTKISHELEKLTRVEETIIVSKKRARKSRM